MNNNYYFLFQYLEKEKITIDKNEFDFQIQSHPDFPSLLSISDTLSFFGVKNGSMRVSFAEYDLLPNNFIALLKEDNSKPALGFIEKMENTCTYTIDKKTLKLLKNH